MSNFKDMGRLTRDFEVRQVGKDYVSTSSIAIQRKYKNKEGNYDVDFIDIQVWGEGFATKMAPKYKKGNRVLVTGNLQTDRYQAKDGTNRTSFKINCERYGGCVLIDFNNNNNSNGFAHKTEEPILEFNENNNFNIDSFSAVGDDEDIPF